MRWLLHDTAGPNLLPAQPREKNGPPQGPIVIRADRKDGSERKADVPTPGSLRREQERYVKARPERRVDKATGLPEPCPPLQSKEDVFKIEQYADIDRHAIQVRRLPWTRHPGQLRCGLDHAVEGSVYMQVTRAMSLTLREISHPDHRVVYVSLPMYAVQASRHVGRASIYAGEIRSLHCGGLWWVTATSEVCFLKHAS